MIIVRQFSKKQYLLAKMIVMSAFIVSGLIVIFLGLGIFLDEPQLKKEHHFDDTLKFKDNSLGDFRINFNAKSGLMVNRGAEPFIQATFHENQLNSSKVEVLFLEGNVINESDRWGSTQKNNPVSLKFEGTSFIDGTNMSNYIASPYLTYDFSGRYGAIITIQNNDTNFKKDFDEVVEIGSWDDYILEKNTKNSMGLTWMIAGIALITVAPTFTRLVDLVKEYFE